MSHDGFINGGKNAYGFEAFTWDVDKSVVASSGINLGAGSAFAEEPGDLSSLRKFLQTQDDGGIVLIKASYLSTLASTHSPFPPRDQLPEEAIVGPAMLERSVAELEAWVTYLQSPEAPEDSQFLRFPPIAIVTYTWGLEPDMYNPDVEHPDPGGQQLKDNIAPALEWYAAQRAKHVKEIEEDSSFSQALARRGCALIVNPDAAALDFCVFLEFSSLEPDSMLQRGYGAASLRRTTVLSENRKKHHYAERARTAETMRNLRGEEARPEEKRNIPRRDPRVAAELPTMHPGFCHKKPA